jgi:hypothetical protein
LDSFFTPAKPAYITSMWLNRVLSLKYC